MANDMLKKMVTIGICNMAAVTLAIESTIKGKIKGALSIYDADQLDAVDEADRDKEVYYVYFLQNKDGEIEYVGRTKHIKARITAHENSTNRKNLKLVGFVRMKKYEACRAVEQAGMLGAHTLKGNNK